MGENDEMKKAQYFLLSFFCFSFFFLVSGSGSLDIKRELVCNELLSLLALVGIIVRHKKVLLPKLSINQIYINYQLVFQLLTSSHSECC